MKAFLLGVSILFFVSINGFAADLPIPLQAQSNQLDLNAIEIPATEIVASDSVSSLSSNLAAALVIAMMFGCVVVATFYGRRKHHQKIMLNLQLITAPVKIIFTSVLLIYALVHVLAALTVYFDTRHIYASTAEYFYYLKPARLLALSHAHLMAITTMNAIVAFVFAISRASSGFVAGVVTMVFVGIVSDIGAWWLIKFYGTSFEWVSMFAGSFFAGGFLLMMFVLLFDIWFVKTNTSAQPNFEEKL